MTQEIEREALREAFEKHMRSLNACTWFSRHPAGGAYRTISVERAWQIWLAALAMKAPAEPVAWGCFFPDGRLEPDLVGCEKDCIYWRDSDDATEKWTAKPLYAGKPPVEPETREVDEAQMQRLWERGAVAWTAAQPPVDEREALRAAYAKGWMNAAKWGDRVDLIADIGSGAYERDLRAALNQAESERVAAELQTAYLDGEFAAQQRAETPPMDAEHWAELYRLREEVKGPDGYATWKDAAVAERILRVRAETPPDEQICEQCKGSGTMMGMSYGQGPDDHEIEVECNRCAGTGAVSPQASPETSEHTEQWWLHKIDMEKSAAWQQGYAQGLHRAQAKASPQPIPIEQEDRTMTGAIEQEREAFEKYWRLRQIRTFWPKGEECPKDWGGAFKRDAHDAWQARAAVEAAKPAPEAVEPLRDEREAFEKWCHSRQIPIEPAHDVDAYLNPEHDDLWDAWQARAALSHSAPEPLDYVSAFMDGLSWMAANRDSRPSEWRDAAIDCAMRPGTAPETAADGVSKDAERP